MTKQVFKLFPVIVVANTLSSTALFASDIPTITITGTREDTLKSETAETVGSIDKETIQQTRPSHPSELLDRIPGVHVSVTGGEGHMTSIRQPITTSPVYLFLEDGIPTRSTGFFNHNALYEVNIPQSAGVEVTKGPGTSLYGSDAIGGVINVLTEASPLKPEASISAEAGEHGWKRLLVNGGNGWEEGGIRASLNLTETDGWRDATDYDRQSANVRWDHMLQSGASLKTILATSSIDQQTAGSSALLEVDYLNDPTKNTTPISYRKVDAIRVSSAYEQESAKTLLSLTPFVRQNSMEYLANWSLSYDPTVLKTESDSLGLLAKYRMDFDAFRTRVIIGADIDYTPGSRTEHSIDAIKTDDIYTSYTRDEKVYDYDVTYQGFSPYVHVETSPSDKLRITAGLRYDNLSYDYSDNMATAPEAYTVSFNGFDRTLTYNRPDDTEVDFNHLSPKLGASYSFSDELNGFVSYRHAFRAPSEGQLFRPGSNAESLDLDPVKVNSYEVGVRGAPSAGINYEVSVYYMSKKDDLVTYTDAITNTRTTVNAGETLHKGIELGASTDISEDLKLAASVSKSEHTYEDWINKGVDFSGNKIESAPETLANIRLHYSPAALNGGYAELEWQHMGEYQMDAANSVDALNPTVYDGHNLFNLRASYYIEKNLQLFARLINATDETYATRAKYSPAGYSPAKSEFSPGMPRTVYAGVEYKF